MLVETLTVEAREKTEDGELFLMGMLLSSFSGFLVGVGFTLLYMRLF